MRRGHRTGPEEDAEEWTSEVAERGGEGACWISSASLDECVDEDDGLAIRGEESSRREKRDRGARNEQAVARVRCNTAGPDFLTCARVFLHFGPDPNEVLCTSKCFKRPIPAL